MYTEDDFIDYDGFTEEDMCCPLGYDCLSMTGESPEDCPNYLGCKTWAATDVGWNLPIITFTSFNGVFYAEVIKIDFDDILYPLIIAGFPDEVLNSVVSDLNKAGYHEPLPIPYRYYEEFSEGKVVSAIFVQNFWADFRKRNRQCGQLLAAGFYPAVPLPYESYGDKENGNKGMIVTESRPELGFVKAQSIYDRAGVVYEML